MKRVVVLTLILILLMGCSRDEQFIKSQEIKINELTSEISSLELERDELVNEVHAVKEENGDLKYVITLNISQSHFTLDLGKHIKDAMNDIEIQLPVDKEFFDNIEEGEILDNSFRVGSLLMEGSWGKWEIKVIKKEVL